MTLEQAVEKARSNPPNHMVAVSAARVLADEVERLRQHYEARLSDMADKLGDAEVDLKLLRAENRRYRKAMRNALATSGQPLTEKLLTQALAGTAKSREEHDD